MVAPEDIISPSVSSEPQAGPAAAPHPESTTDVQLAPGSRERLSYQHEVAHLPPAQQSSVERSAAPLVAQATYVDQNIDKPSSPVKTSPVQKSEIELQTRVSELYRAMRGGVTGLGTHERALFRSLEGLSREEVGKIKAIYKEQFGRDAEKEIRAELGQDKRFLQRAEPLLAGDALKSCAAGLHLECSIPTTDVKEMHRLLRDYLGKAENPDQAVTDLLAAYKDEYGVSLDVALSQKLKGPDQVVAQALLDLDATRATAGDVAGIISQASKRGVDAAILDLQEVLADCPDGVRADVSEQVLRILNAGSVRELMKNYDASTAEAAAALLQGEPALADAIRLHNAIRNLPALPEVIVEVFAEAGPEASAVIAKIYREEFGSDLLGDLAGVQRLSGRQKEILANVIEYGAAQDADIIELSLMQRPPQVRPILELVHSKTAEEIRVLSNHYEARGQTTLVSDIQKNFAGQQRFDVHLALVGRPANIDDEVVNINALHEFERKGKNALSARAFDLCSRQGKVYDLHVGKVNELYTRRGPRPDDEEEGSKFQILAGLVEDDLETYRDAKSKLSRALGMSSGIVAGLLSFACCHSARLPLWESFAFALLVCVFSRLVIERYLRGRAYAGDDIIEQVRARRAKSFSASVYRGWERRKKIKDERRRFSQRKRRVFKRR